MRVAITKIICPVILSVATKVSKQYNSFISISYFLENIFNNYYWNVFRKRNVANRNVLSSEFWECELYQFTQRQTNI